MEKAIDLTAGTGSVPRWTPTSGRRPVPKWTARSTDGLEGCGTTPCSEKDKHLVTHCGRSFRSRTAGPGSSSRPVRPASPTPGTAPGSTSRSTSWSGRGGGPVLAHASADDWTDDLHTHTDKVSEQKQRAEPWRSRAALGGPR